MVEEILINIVAGVALVWLGWLAKILYNKRKYSLFRFVRKFKVFHSGAQGYYYSFPPEDNKKTWEEINSVFYYVGVSANTFINELIDFTRSEKGQKIDYKFLLMNPFDEENILKQETFKGGYKDISKIDAAKKEKLMQDVKITKNNILLNIDRIKNTDCYKNGNVKLKFFSEFLPWWIYIFDDNKIYVGLLKFGKDGRDSPLVILEKHEKHFTLYDAFKNNCNRIWNDAIDLDKLMAASEMHDNTNHKSNG